MLNPIENKNKVSQCLLPFSSTKLEHDLAQLFTKYTAPKVDIASLWHPQHCPLALLPHLAWALSVDRWQSDWPEARKRQVLSNSLAQHRIKGSRPALQQAISNLGIHSNIIEWFECTPNAAPYTAEVVVALAQLTTQQQGKKALKALTEDIKSAIHISKNTRTQVTLSLSSSASSPWHFAGAANPNININHIECICQ